MASKYKRICYLCGKQYQYCSSCRDFNTQPAWKNMFHNENCHKLFNLSTQFAQGSRTLEEARKILSECDLTDINNFRADVINQINIIKNSEPTVIKEKVETKVETKVSQEEKDVDAKNILPEATAFKRKKKSMKRTSEKKVFNEQ